MAKKIMIIDDDKEFLEELAEAIASSGYDPIAVNDTDGLLDLVVKTKPAVILLDLKMPKKTGFLVAYELQESSDTVGIPVIAMSGYVKDGHIAPKELVNIRTCLKKPFTPEDVIAEIEKALTEEARKA